MLYVRLIYRILYSIRMSKTNSKQENSRGSLSLVERGSDKTIVSLGTRGFESHTSRPITTQICHKNNSDRLGEQRLIRDDLLLEVSN